MTHLSGILLFSMTHLSGILLLSWNRGINTTPLVTPLARTYMYLRTHILTHKCSYSVYGHTLLQHGLSFYRKKVKSRKLERNPAIKRGKYWLNGSHVKPALTVTLP